jgi:hypothetical protein
MTKSAMLPTSINHDMPQELPNLKGLVTKEMVKTIGTGKYAATYTPWAKIAELLNDKAPGWQPELVLSQEGTHAHRAPIGGYLVIRFRNIFTGAVTTEWIQSIQDNRHQSIPWDKIDSRDVSDTSRRGFALAAAAVFNLGIELWTRDPLESGYSRVVEESGDVSPAVQAATKPAATDTKPDGAAPPAATSKETFLEAALTKGLTTHAAEALAVKLKGNYAGGIDRLKEKDDAWVKSFNEASAPKNSAEQW